jgi:geranylgeranylglycerol-phosphate geranylgeranyltransferase
VYHLIKQDSSTLKDVADLIRLHHCVLASIVVFAASYITHRLNYYESGDAQNFLAFLADNPVLPPEGLFLGFWITFALIGATHSINDYFDYEIDIANERFDRPIVRGAISRESAKNGAIGLFAFALFFSIILVAFFELDAILLPLVVMLIFISVSYNYGVKRHGLLGNAWVSTGYVFPFLIGSAFVGMDTFAAANIIVICAFIFFLALGREILKDIMDVEGDKKSAMRSVAIINGAQWAARLSFLCFIITMAFGVVLMFMGFKNNPLFLIGMIILSGFLLYTGILVIRNPDVATTAKGRKYTQWSLWLATSVAFFSSLFLP